MKITILGSGTLALCDRNPSGILIESDQVILLDAGFGIIRRYIDCGKNLQDLDLICISHFHTDHFSDCFPIIHSRFVQDAYRNVKKHKKVIVLGPEGLRERYKKWREIFWSEPSECYPVDIQEAGEIKTGKIVIRTFPVYHVPWFKSVGFVLNIENKKIVYTGDIGSKHDFDELVKTCKDADLLITEASYEQKTPNHFTIKQIQDLIEKASVKKAIAVHIRPQHEKRAKELLAGDDKLEMSHDGMEIYL